MVLFFRTNRMEVCLMEAVHVARVSYQRGGNQIFIAMMEFLIAYGHFKDSDSSFNLT